MKALIEAAYPYRDPSRTLRDADAGLSSFYASGGKKIERQPSAADITPDGFPLTAAMADAIGASPDTDSAESDAAVRDYFLCNDVPALDLTPEQAAYLHEQLSVDTAEPVSRVMAWIFESRPDLHSSFKLGTPEYAAWFYYSGLAEYPRIRQLPDALLERLRFLAVNDAGQLELQDSPGLRHLLIFRPDIQELLLSGGGMPRFLHWLRAHGTLEHPIIKILSGHLDF